MIRKLFLSVAILAAATVASQADVVEGNWKREKTGVIIKFQTCGAGYCAIVQTGKFAGKQAGTMKGKNGSYRGTLTDLEKEKTYTGKMKINGKSADMAGCILGGLACVHETWTKQ